MMGRRLEQGAGCLLNLDPGQNAPSQFMQGTCTAHTYHLKIHLRRVHGVVRVAPLGELCSSINQQRCNYIIMISCATLSYCQTTRSWHDVYHPPSTRCDLHRQIHWSTLCAWYVQHSQEFHTPVQYMCNWKVGFSKSWLHWANVLYPASCHPLQPRIAEFWFVYGPQNLEIELWVVAQLSTRISVCCFVLLTRGWGRLESPFLDIFSFSGHEISIESGSLLVVLGSHIPYAWFLSLNPCTTSPEIYLRR